MQRHVCIDHNYLFKGLISKVYSFVKNRVLQKSLVTSDKATMTVPYVFTELRMKLLLTARAYKSMS
jgi:hypothetical protein